MILGDCHVSPRAESRVSARSEMTKQSPFLHSFGDYYGMKVITFHITNLETIPPKLFGFCIKRIPAPLLDLAAVMLRK